jgi:hypothetical protein
MPSKEEFKMYDTHCKGQFEAILEMATEAKAERKIMSDRLFKTNGKRSVVACIEDNKNEIKRHVAATEKAPAKTIRKLSVGVKGITAQGYPGADMVKILLIVLFILYIVGRDHGHKVIKAVLGQGIEEIAHVAD